jgi:hypothetical protein
MQQAYKEVAKELIPTILYPTPKEYRQTLEKYLAENAEGYIDNVGRNTWISIFTEKHNHQVCHKLYKSGFFTFNYFCLILDKIKMPQQTQ